MTQTIRWIACGVAIAGMTGVPADAWGPDARKTIAVAALQTIRVHFPETFKSGGVSYESDMLRGTETGLEVIRASVPMRTEEQAIAAISNQIYLLREMRKHGAGSYFAYRMGGLAALTADAIMPYGLAQDENGKALKAQIDNILDERMSTFSVPAVTQNPQYLRTPAVYFSSKRAFHPDDRRMIADDLARRRGSAGFLRQAGQSYFQRSVEAVIDVWFTVLRAEGDATDVIPSPVIQTEYLVDEIRYLLEVKKNFEQASRVYLTFNRINPQNMEAYERVGDLYYAFGGDAGKERGVREWQIAQGAPGPQRKRAALKLSEHYMQTGESLFRRAQSATAKDTDLDEALRAFQNALQYNRDSALAADRINETTLAIAKRTEMREAQRGFLDQAARVISEADRQVTEQSYASAISLYNAALNVLEGVNQTFADLYKESVTLSAGVATSIGDVVRQILNNADELMQAGEDALRANRFDEAINSFRAARQEANLIPDDLDRSTSQQKEDLILRADGKAAEAEAAKARFSQGGQPGGPPQGLGGGAPPGLGGNPPGNGA